MLSKKMCRRASGGQGVRAAIFLLPAVLAAQPALAKPEPGKFTGSVFGGVDFPVKGNVHKGATAPVADLGALNPALAGTAAELGIEKRSHNKIYGEGYNAGVEMAYGVSESGEAFGSYRYGWTGKGRAQVGGAFIPAQNRTLPVNATFGNAKSHSVELGYRQYFGDGNMQPYGAVRGGVGFHDNIRASFAIPDANIAVNDARFFKKSTTFSGGLDLGVAMDVGTNVSLAAETGLRYHSKLKGDDRDISGLGLAAINNTGSRLSVPITLKLRAGF